MSKTESTESKQEPQDEGAPSKADLLSLKLKEIASYIAIGFAPIAAAAALALAVIAIIVTQSAQTQSGDATTKLEKLNASLNANRIELEKLKAELAQSKAMNDEAHKQQAEQTEKLVQAISQLQAKLKVSPTLQEQMLHPASAPVVPAASAAPPPVTAAPTTPPADKKSSAQIQALKQALEKFNKQ